jgi:hypothetical protein
MSVPCNIRRSRNNQHYAQICTTGLFYILAPTCFGSSLPLSESFWICPSYMKTQFNLMLYHTRIMWLSGQCAGVSWVRRIYKHLEIKKMLAIGLNKETEVTSLDEYPTTSQ